MRMDKKKIKQSCIASALKECVAVVCGFVVVVCAFFGGGREMGDGGQPVTRVKRSCLLPDTL